MKLIEDWKKKFPKLWSIRFALLSAFASAVESGVDLYANNTPKPLVVAAMLASLFAALARIVAQPSLAEDENGK